MNEIVKILKNMGFDLLYSETRLSEIKSHPTSYMIWMKNNRYFLLECSIEAMDDFIKEGINININHWLNDLTNEDLQKMIDLGLPDIKKTIREIRLRKLLKY